LQEAHQGIKKAERELPDHKEGHTLRDALDEYIKEKVRRGLCGQEDL
jgi:hypothetical protein